MQLTNKGGRDYTRGWSGSKYVKKQTARKARRHARASIRDNDGEITKALVHGWVW